MTSFHNQDKTFHNQDKKTNKPLQVPAASPSLKTHLAKTSLSIRNRMKLMDTVNWNPSLYRTEFDKVKKSPLNSLPKHNEA